MNHYLVREPSGLLKSLFDHLKGTSKTTVRDWLKRGMVHINGKSSTRFDFPVKAGDKIEIKKETTAKFHSQKFPFSIIYEDAALLVVEKPAGLPSIATARSRERSLYFQVHEYLKSISPQRKWQGFIVHRLDREVSGIMIFAKTETAKESLQRNWNQFEKRYQAVAEGRPKKEKDSITSYLHENKFLKVYTGPKNEQGKLAITQYEVLRSNGRFSLLDLKIDTGRKHQIRVHLSDIGCPVVGDEKYGSKVKMPKKYLQEAKRIALHAYEVTFTHPTTGKRMTLQSKVPQEILDLLK